MTDKVLCPWCGSEMRINTKWYYDCSERERKVWNAWCECRNEDCGTRGPYVLECPTEEDAITLALNRAFRLYEPPIRPMTMEEIKEHRDRQEAIPIWIEWKFTPEENGWILSRTMNVMTIKFNNLLWRCWPRKPTEEEREAHGWED